MSKNGINKQPDKIITLSCGSIIQHGFYNDRVYLIKGRNDSFAELPQILKLIAEEKGYTKVLAKVPMQNIVPFIQAGYLMESFIPKFYHGSFDAFLLSFYFF